MTSTRAGRPAARRTLVLLAAGCSLLGGMALPASAGIGDPGNPSPLSSLSYYLIDFGIPILVFLVVGLLCLRPRKGVGALHYRPGRSWGFEEMWFGEQPHDTGRPRAAVPGAGGASGTF